MNKLISLLTTLLVPVALLFLPLRLMLTPAFPEIEYRMPGFPNDSYGFTREDRLEWSKVAIEYLVNDAGIEFLGQLTFPDGSPLYNERELGHMLDVKNVVRPVLVIGTLSWAGLLGLGLWAWSSKRGQAYRSGLVRGGWLMVGLAAAVGAFAAVAFWQFFTLFHSLFFEGDSWLFEYSDTLIRLFPLRFWQDVFAFAAVFAVGGGLALALGLKPKIK